jgi:hypothetical protein
VFNVQKINMTSIYKNKFFIFFFSLIIISLTGCATSPQTFGISDAEWNGYSKEKQKETLSNYEQLNKEVMQQDREASQMLGNLDATTLDVKIFGGQAVFPPFVDWQSYMPFTATVMENSCTNAEVDQVDGEKMIVKTTLRLCYKDKKLRLDPSMYDPDKKEGTATIPYSPLWDQGFVYHGINTYGHVKLKDVNVIVQQN